MEYMYGQDRAGMFDLYKTEDSVYYVIITLRQHAFIVPITGPMDKFIFVINEYDKNLPGYMSDFILDWKEMRNSVPMIANELFPFKCITPPTEWRVHVKLEDMRDATDLIDSQAMRDATQTPYSPFHHYMPELLHLFAHDRIDRVQTEEGDTMITFRNTDTFIMMNTPLPRQAPYGGVLFCETDIWTNAMRAIESSRNVVAIDYQCVRSNIATSVAALAFGIVAVRRILLDHRIRMFQRLWKRWWYQPNAEGYVRFASRMYDVDMMVGDDARRSHTNDEDGRDVRSEEDASRLASRPQG